MTNLQSYFSNLSYKTCRTILKTLVIGMLPEFRRINAFPCAIDFNEKFGINIDYHEFAYILDELRTAGVLVIDYSTNYSGTSYQIVQK